MVRKATTGNAVNQRWKTKIYKLIKRHGKMPEALFIFPGILFAQIGFFRLSLRQTDDRANTPLEWSRQKWQLA